MSRPIKAILHTNNMAHNLQIITSSVKAHPENQNKTIKRLAVIKANAYGHGLAAAMEGFKDADGFGMIDLEDAAILRKNGVTQDILLLEGFFHKSDIETMLNLGVSTAIHSLYQINYLKEELPRLISRGFKPVNLFIKFNTGMNRLGFKPSEAQKVYEQLAEFKSTGLIKSIGSMMHFANADTDNRDAEVVRIEEEFVKNCMNLGGHEVPVSLCNSAACVRYPRFAGIATENWIRPGSVLYGSQYFPNLNEQNVVHNFKPAMSLVADIIAIQNLKAGDSVGYGSKFTATKDCRIAVVACGYADGYPRSATNETEVGVLGKRAKLAGRVSMDMIAIDISHIPEANIGTPVVLWGEGGPNIDEAAQLCGRISYELICGITPRVPKVLDNGQS